MKSFKLITDYVPKGDQPGAIKELAGGVEKGVKHQVLLGVTGSGKTFTMANVIKELERPALVLAPNKTLAAQLFSEFKELFPENAVEYFVSYYDYYQPEAYVPSSDTFIEKDASINDAIDKMRHSATRSLLTRRDVIIVASVSCIYGIGSPEDYGKMFLYIEKEMDIARDDVLARLVEIQYQRNDFDFSRGSFRVRGDVIDIFPVYEEDKAIRIAFFGDTVESISEIEPLRGRVLRGLKKVIIYPGSHYVTSKDNLKKAMDSIRKELAERLRELNSANKLVEAQRLEQRTCFDLELMEEMGFCPGIENYSRHIDGRKPGKPPFTLIDYFPEDYLFFVDESHISIPQLGGMYRGDRSRKQTLVEYGFRLPCALDNRPLQFEEFEERANRIVYASATPGDYELEKAGGVIVEQIIRPTGLIDPEIVVKPATQQVDDLLHEIRERVQKEERVLVTTLTKKMAEDLTSYYAEVGIKVRYLHSDIHTLERMEIIRELRKGEFDVLVGINLLREGLDLPEVSLVAILDADKEGFLRSTRSLIQTCGRAARNLSGKVIMYADLETRSIHGAIDETNRRRKIQRAHNEKMGITPESVRSSIKDIRSSIYEEDYPAIPSVSEEKGKYQYMPKGEARGIIKSLKKEMKEASLRLEFEKAAELRDRIKELELMELEVT